MKNVFIAFLPFLNTIVLVASHGTMTHPVPRQPMVSKSELPDFYTTIIPMHGELDLTLHFTFTASTISIGTKLGA